MATNFAYTRCSPIAIFGVLTICLAKGAHATGHKVHQRIASRVARERERSRLAKHVDYVELVLLEQASRRDAMFAMYPANIVQFREFVLGNFAVELAPVEK